MKHELVLRVMQMDCAVDDEAGRIDIGRALEHLAVFVDLDQVGCGDFLVQQSESVHQESMLGARHTCGDVIPDSIVPAEKVGQAKHRGQIDARLPLGRTRIARALGAGEIFSCNLCIHFEPPV